MYPSTEDETSSLRLRELIGRLDYLEVERRELHRSYKHLYERFLNKLEAVIPILPSGASQDEWHEAVKHFCHRCPTLVEELTILRQMMKRQKDEYCATWYALDNEKTDMLTFSDWRKLNTHRSHVHVEEESFEYECMGSMDYQVVQYYVHKIMKDQSEEIRRFVLGKYNPFCTRLQIRRKEQPEVSLGRHDLPLEVADMVFDNCDLESCVSLREVSKQWYHSFQQCHTTLKKKLLKRAPWFYNDDMSWADSVLIFVRRKRWDFFGQTKVNHVTTKKLVATKLQQGDTITSDFIPLSYPIKPLSSFSNTDIVLPKGTEIRSIETLSFHILVVTFNGLFVFHRDNPLHHEHSIYSTSQATDKYVQVGRFLFRQDEVTGVHFFDFSRKKLVSYGPLKNWKPVAVYKGIVWMYSEGVVIPTFMDLEQGMFIVRKDKTMRVNSTQFRQSISAPRMAAVGSCMIDFETGTVNDIETAFEPLNEVKRAVKRPQMEEPSFLMGYIGDMFHVYWAEKSRGSIWNLLEEPDKYEGSIWNMLEEAVTFM